MPGYKQKLSSNFLNKVFVSCFEHTLTMRFEDDSDWEQSANELKNRTTYRGGGGGGPGGTRIIFWRGCASQNPEMGVLRFDYKHKI